MQYTSQQNEAINIINNNLQIIACAGSGKTQVISERIIKLLQEPSIQPKNIVAFTFTEKAAAELKHRVRNIAQKESISTLGLAELYIGTIHSWCLHYLQDYVYGYQKFSVLNDVRLKLFIDKNYYYIGMHDLKVSVKDNDDRDLIRFKETGKFLEVLNILREGRLKQGCALPIEYSDVVAKYERKLEENAFLDFTMIFSKFLKELKDNQDLRDKIAQDIKYLVVDEYQDINDIQENIIEEIHNLGAYLCVVGDDDQTIYQWRGSSSKNILGFEKKYDKVQQVVLNDNFRSSTGIIDVAQKVISYLPEDKRLSKNMRAVGHQNYEQGDIHCESLDNYDKEDQYIAKMIKALYGKAFIDKNQSNSRGLDYSDMVILLRKWGSIGNLKNVLKKNKIPFVVTGVNQLFATDEVKACVNIYKYLHSQITDQELINSWKSFCLLKELNIQKAVSFLDRNHPKKGAWYEYFNLQEIFIKFREIIGCVESCIPINYSEIVFYNIGMFSQVIEDFEAIHFKDSPIEKLKNFFYFLEYSAKDYYPEGWLNKSILTFKAVTITTVHQAKGLEWPVVFLPRMNKNTFPPKKPGGVNPWHIIDKKLFENIEGYIGSIEDELRLLYVAVTRSKKFLFITHAPGEKKIDKKESDFIQYVKQSKYIYSDIDYDFQGRNKALIQNDKGLDDILLNFSLLEAFFECPYSFKYHILYGFKEPLNSRIGYGKSIHDTLMEIHRKAMDDQLPSQQDLNQILDHHLHFPYAIDKVKKEMEVKARKAISKYYSDNLKDFDKIEYAEKDIEVNLGNGIIVNGRIDLIIKRDLSGVNNTYIVDFKSEYDPLKRSVIEKQLLLYALGYHELTGKMADFIEIYDFKTGTPTRIKLTSKHLQDIKNNICDAANKIRENMLDTACHKSECSCRFKGDLLSN